MLLTPPGKTVPRIVMKRASKPMRGMPDDASSLLIPDAQASERVLPAEHSFDYPAPFSRVLRGFNAVPGKPHRNAALAQPDAVAMVVVALIAMRFRRALAGRPERPATDGSAVISGCSMRES